MSQPTDFPYSSFITHSLVILISNSDQYLISIYLVFNSVINWKVQHATLHCIAFYNNVHLLCTFPYASKIYDLTSIISWSQVQNP